MTRARNLANLGNKNAITADIGLFNIGIGSTQPTNYKLDVVGGNAYICLLYTSPSPRDKRQSRMPSSA